MVFLFVEVDGRSLDAVISRMSLGKRLLYHVMPSSSKKRLQKHSEGRQNRATRGTQTGTELLEVSDQIILSDFSKRDSQKNSAAFRER